MDASELLRKVASEEMDRLASVLPPYAAGLDSELIREAMKLITNPNAAKSDSVAELVVRLESMHKLLGTTITMLKGK